VYLVLQNLWKHSMLFPSKSISIAKVGQWQRLYRALCMSVRTPISTKRTIILCHHDSKGRAVGFEQTATTLQRAWRSDRNFSWARRCGGCRIAIRHANKLRCDILDAWGPAETWCLQYAVTTFCATNRPALLFLDHRRMKIWILPQFWRPVQCSRHSTCQCCFP
jgi:hypothetical protein